MGTLTPEGKVKAKITAWLRTLTACWYFLPIGGAYSMVGVPDIIVCMDGVFVAIEVKAPGKIRNTSARQKYVMSQIATAGGHVIVVDNLEMVREYFVSAGLVSA